MGKFATALASDKSHPGSPCLVAAALTGLDKDDVAALTAALASVGHTVTYAAITRSLRTAGYKAGHAAVSRHVAGECACGAAR